MYYEGQYSNVPDPITLELALNLTHSAPVCLTSGLTSPPVLALDRPSLEPTFDKPLGQHIVVEFEQAHAERLADVDFVEQQLVAAAKAAGVTIMTQHFASVPIADTKTGTRQGVSGALILAESHFTVHTDPTHGYAALDLFTCGGHTDPRIAFEMLIDAFQPETIRYQEYQRGFLDSASQKMLIGPAVLRSSSVH